MMGGKGFVCVCRRCVGGGLWHFHISVRVNYSISLCCCHCRHSPLVHDHCYSKHVSRPNSSTSQPLEAGTESGKMQKKEDIGQVKDLRRCVLCPTEGDAECNVSLDSGYAHRVFSLIYQLNNTR